MHSLVKSTLYFTIASTLVNYKPLKISINELNVKGRDEKTPKEGRKRNYDRERR